MTSTAELADRSGSASVAEQLPPWIPAAFRHPTRPWLILVAAPLLTLTGGYLLSLLAAVLFPNLGRPEFPPLNWILQLFNLVVFAPVVETLIMAGMLAIFRRWLAVLPAILCSAALWGIAHSFAAAAWGLVIWWPFTVFSLVYVVWRQRGFWTGIGMAATAHALNNLAPAILLVTGSAT